MSLFLCNTLRAELNITSLSLRRPLLRSISTTQYNHQQINHTQQYNNTNTHHNNDLTTNKPYIPVREHISQWHLYDAASVPVGRLAVTIARLLMGKHRVDYTPHRDCGDYVVVLNVDKIKFTGDKWTQKQYYKHSGYPGGLHVTPASRMRDNHPDWILRFAVGGNIPQNKLKKPRMSRLKCYVGTAHPHQAQFPQHIALPSTYIQSISTRSHDAEESAYQAVLADPEFQDSHPLQPRMGGQKAAIRELVRKEKKEKQAQSRKNNE